MPILIVKLCTTPTPEISRCVAAALTDLTVEILKKKRELTAVAIEYVPAAEWFIAGKTLASQPHGTFHLDIKVTEGTNTKDEKAHFVSRVFAALEEIIGPLAPASYIVVHDVRGDSWGYQGQTQEYRYVRSKSL
ncbi:MAG: tautomerase family protein [Propionivibrio sp.]|uniref:tautomerase family protein n=1 Tax=Propionivibrio sp. TaxID=2212460 RepID=UPI001A50B804|nr:tautomerase family protein [Propionivibrio sp.]MBL8414013.1 tautomerase family protein [Propionivibrio sp.]